MSKHYLHFKINVEGVNDIPGTIETVGVASDALLL